MALTITKDNFNEEVLESNLPVLIDFWAEWCTPCKMIAPTIEELTIELQGKVKVCKINVDEESELARSFNISSIPTLCVMQNKKVIASTLGVQSKAAILKLLGL